MILGTISWKFTIAPEITIALSVWKTIFFTLCLGKGILKLFNKHVTFISITIFALGIFLLVSTGFSWLKLIILISMVFSKGVVSACFAIDILIMAFIQHVGEIDFGSYSGYSWTAYALLSFAIVLLYQYILLNHENRKTLDKSKIRRLYWISICTMYILLLVNSILMNTFTWNMYKGILGEKIMNYMSAVDLRMVGITGVILCVFWLGREKVLILYQNRKKKKESVSLFY